MTDILINSILWLRLSVLYSLIQHTLITYDIASDVEDSAVMMLVETTRCDPGWHMGLWGGHGAGECGSGREGFPEDSTSLEGAQGEGEAQGSQTKEQPLRWPGVVLGDT